MEKLNVIELKCKQGFTLTTSEGVVIATKGGQSERFPISQMQSVKFRLGRFLDPGVLTFKIGSNSVGIGLGMGIGIGLGGEKIFLFHKDENDTAQKFYDYICYCQEHPTASADTAGAAPSGSVVAVADEIRALKGLLEDGIITNEEFTAKKKQLLGI